MYLNRTRRSGFTLVELLVTLIIMGVVLGSVMTLLVRQQRFYRSTNDMMDARTQVRQAIDMLPADLRGLSSSDTRNGTDMYAASDKAIDFRTITGSSVLCRILNTTTVILPPLNLASGTALSTWTGSLQVGDSLLVYDDSTSASGNNDDHWAVYGVTAVATVDATNANACGTASRYVSAADVTAGRVSYMLTLSPAMTATISIGAPVRIFHRRRYELYQASGSSNNWYLGTYECRTACGTLTPVSGPFAAYSASAGSSGLSFTYLDSLGNAIPGTPSAAQRATIARITIAARADTHGEVDIPGKARGTLRDSLSLDVILRNRK
jgi:prepilin-type N-terminal cleavage/methylation domain-containing protein